MSGGCSCHRNDLGPGECSCHHHVQSGARSVFMSPSRCGASVSVHVIAFSLGPGQCSCNYHAVGPGQYSCHRHAVRPGQCSCHRHAVGPGQCSCHHHVQSGARSVFMTSSRLVWSQVSVHVIVTSRFFDGTLPPYLSSGLCTLLGLSGPVETRKTKQKELFLQVQDGN